MKPPINAQSDPCDCNGRFAQEQRGPFSDLSVPFGKSVQRTWKHFARKPAVWLVLAVLILAGYGYAMCVPAVGIDDLAIEVYQQGGGFLRQERITEFLMQAATGLLTFQTFWPELFAALCLAFAGMILAAILYAAAQRPVNVAGVLLLAGGLLLYPFHAEAFAYSNLILTALGILLNAVALWLAGGHILQGCQWRGAVWAAVCLAFSLGCYESLAQVWLTLVFALLLTKAVATPAGSCSRNWCIYAVLRGLWPLLAGLLLRSALAKLLCTWMNITGEDGAAAKTVYWFQRESVGEALRIFVREFLGNYLALPFGVPALALLVLACAALILWTAIRRHGNGCGWLTLGLLLSIFAMGILQGTGSQMARASQCFAVFVPYVAWLLLLEQKRSIGIVVCVLLLLVEGISLNAGIRLDRKRWQYEQAILQSVGQRLDALDAERNLPVVFC